MLTPLGYGLGFGDYAFRVGWSNFGLALQMALVCVAVAAPAPGASRRWRALVLACLASMAVLTLWRGNIHLNVPMLFAIAFIFTFVNGGLTGLFLGNVVVDMPLSDTMFVVAHFHMVMGIAPVLVVFGAIYHWYPKITGRMLDDTLGKIHFWITFIGTYAIFYPMHYLGFMGVPRRYYAIGGTGFIPDSAHLLNAWISIAAFVVGAAQLLFLYNLAISWRRGEPARGNPWHATTLEWQTPETPPAHGNFGKELPVVYRWAYDYGVPGLKTDFIPQNVPPAEVPAEAWVKAAQPAGA